MAHFCVEGVESMRVVRVEKLLSGMVIFFAKGVQMDTGGNSKSGSVYDHGRS